MTSAETTAIIREDAHLTHADRVWVATFNADFDKFGDADAAAAIASLVAPASATGNAGVRSWDEIADAFTAGKR